MRLLFSSDLHGMDAAFERFAELLATRGYNAGILAGDLLDDYLSDEQIMELLGVEADALLYELPGEDEDVVAVWRQSEAVKRMDDALAIRVRRLEAVLDAAGVPILIVLGNHDRTPWPDTDYIRDIHLKRVELGGRTFAGYRWTTMDLTEDRSEVDIGELGKIVDSATVLVSHSPPWGILDGKGRRAHHDGLPALRRLRPRPWLHLFGHVHGHTGQRGRYVNGSWPRLRKFFELDVERRRVRLVD